MTLCRVALADKKAKSQKSPGTTNPVICRRIEFTTL